MSPVQVVRALLAATLVGLVPFASPTAVTAQTALTPPSNLQLLALDSTIRANWIPSPDPNAVGHVFSVWDGATLISTKMLSRTANAADGNGLAARKPYTIKVQAIDRDGRLSSPVSATEATDSQSPMKDVGFFENFNDCREGDLDSNYFDVRTGNKPNHPFFLSSQHKAMHFANECHFHTQVFGGSDDAGVFIRSRVPFDFANRTGTFQIEVDTPPVQAISGKWMELVLTRDIPGTESQFSDQGDAIPSGGFPNSITFGIFGNSGSSSDRDFNVPIIKVNIDGAVRTFTGSFNQYTPSNVRIPLAIKVSRTSAELFLNGRSAVTATGFTLPFTKGYWLVNHRSTYSNRVHDSHNSLPQMLQVLHWDTLQFDGPHGSYNPLVRTYIEPGCKGVVNISDFNSSIDSCPISPALGRNINLNIDEDVARARTAKLLFYTYRGIPSGTISINGNRMSVPTPPQAGHYWNFLMNEVDVPTAWLKQGANMLSFEFSGDMTQVELEVVYNIPRVLADNAGMAASTPMIAITNQNLRVEHLASDSPIHHLTTYLYNSGSTPTVSYSAEVVSPAATPWLRIISPTVGTLISPAQGGGSIPLGIAVDFSNLPIQSDLDNNYLGLIRVAGGNVATYVGVGAFNYGRSTYSFIVTDYPNLGTSFNKAAVIHYHGAPSCQPRPRVAVSAARGEPGRLLVTIVATGDPGAPDNLVHALRVTRTDNAVVDVADQTDRVGAFSIDSVDLARQLTFGVRRAGPGPATVHLVVSDDCGEWPTFVGGGTSAF